MRLLIWETLGDISGNILASAIRSRTIRILKSVPCCNCGDGTGGAGDTAGGEVGFTCAGDGGAPLAVGGGVIATGAAAIYAFLCACFLPFFRLGPTMVSAFISDFILSLEPARPLCT